MEFMNRNNGSGQQRPSASNTPNANLAARRQEQPQSDPLGDVTKKAEVATHSGWFRWSFVALLFSATALFVAMLLFIVFGTPAKQESKFVAKDRYQAVFVNVNGTNGGQVYFGRITEMSNQYIHLNSVFYIQNQQGQNQNSSYNLVKLGCELHGPEDEMVINRSQVFFWENLKPDSQVAQKAAEFYKQNPNGQKCNGNSNSTQQSSGSTNEAPSTSNTGNTNPTVTPPVTPPTDTTKKQ